LQPDAVLDETNSFWQAQAHREVSQEDVREITENLIGFFTTLARWDARPDATGDSTDTREVTRL
jgi:hypothetical protein